MNTYLCDRLTPGKNTHVTFEIEARSGAEAKNMAELLAYACGFAEGLYPDRHHKHCDQWLIVEAQYALGQLKYRPKPKRGHKSGADLDAEDHRKTRQHPQRRRKAGKK